MHVNSLHLSGPPQPPTPQESRYGHMNEMLCRVLPAERTLPEEQETSDENAWQKPGYEVVETALEVTAYALGDR